MHVGDVVQRALEVPRRRIEQLLRLRAAVVVGDLLERIEAEHRKNVIDDSAQEHRGRQVTAIGGGNVDLTVWLHEPGEVPFAAADCL